MTAPGVPRIVPLLGVVGLLIAVNRYAPGTLQAVLVLLVIYALTANLDRAAQLVGAIPGALGRAYAPVGATGGGGGGKKRA